MKPDLSLVPDAPDEYRHACDAIADLPGMKQVCALPDAGMSNHETPYGVVAVNSDYIIPQLLGRVIGCAMSVLRFRGSAEDSRVIDAARQNYRNLLKFNHAQTREDIEAIADGDGLGSIRALFGDVRLAGGIGEPSKLESLLSGGVKLEEIVPPWVLKRVDKWSFPGARFTKNHFIEFSRHAPVHNGFPSAVDDNAFFAAFHFESPLSGRLNSFYSGTRRKDRSNGAFLSARAWARYAEKAIFHAAAGGPVDYVESARHFLRHKMFTPIPIQSHAGQRYLRLLQFIQNYERTAQIAFALHLSREVQQMLNVPLEAELIFSASHNEFTAELHDGAMCVVSRKNCIPASVQEFGLVSGMYDVPSLLVRKRPEAESSGVSESWADSFDHGIGNHLWRDFSSGAFSSTERVGDLSQFERSARLSDSKRLTEYDTVGQCTVLRISASRVQTNTSGVRVGNSLRHVLDAYATAPVEVAGVLVPFLNLKEER